MLEKPPSESATQTRKHDQVYSAGQRASVRLLVVVRPFSLFRSTASTDYHALIEAETEEATFSSDRTVVGR